MPSWQARLFNAYVRLVIRRRAWGTDDHALARRARRYFGAPPVLQRIAMRGVQATPLSAPAPRGEWVLPRGAEPRPDAPVLLYVHGGGYVAGSARAHRPVTAALARATGWRVLAVDYRLAPEQRFPGAFEDVVAAYHWLVTTGAPGAPVVLAGDSAGGGLVLALAQHARDAHLPAPVCVVALSPWTDLQGTGTSLRTNDGACHMFRPENVDAFAGAYLGRTGAAHDFRCSPLRGSPRGLPPVLMQVASTELLLDDARRMHERIRAVDGTSTLTVYEDVSHGWHVAGGLVPETRAAIEEIARFARAHVARGAAAAPAA